MTITLYKNCCLNNKYQEVFYHEKLETYLNSLNKFILNLEETYYENNMEIVIDYTWFQSEGGLYVTKNIYDYNYCKITETVGLSLQPNLIRYCFIKSINVKNSCVYLELEEDIWASFSSKIEGSNVCTLVNSRRSYYNTENLFPLKLPYEFDGNNNLDVLEISSVKSNYCYLIAEIQFYQLSSNKWTKAFSRYYLLAKGMADHSTRVNKGDKSIFLLNKDFVYKGALNLISHALDKQYYSSDAVLGDTGDYLYNYKVGNIYVIPSTFDVTKFFRTDETYWTSDAYRSDYSEITMPYVETPGLLLYELKNNENILKELLSVNISNDYKNYSVGPITNQIKIENNSTYIECKILATVTSNSFNLYLNIQNQLIEITEDYEYVAPYESIDAAEFQQRKISLAIKNNSLNYSMFSHSVDISNDQNKIVGGVGKAIGSYYSGNIGGMFGGIEQAVSSLHDTAKNIGSLVKLNKEKELINTPKYSNVKGTGRNSAVSLNYLSGIFLTQIIPDNVDIVKNFVDNFGFACYKFLNSTFFDYVIKTDLYIEGAFTYNSIRISSPNVYGQFTNDIANKINEILENGVKIWYDPARNLDDYTDWLLE